MRAAAHSYGYSIICWDTDSIFVHTEMAMTRVSRMSRALKLKSKIVDDMRETVFEMVGADVKGNCMSIITSKKYDAVFWSGTWRSKLL
jgi:hypothetical protein